ncbi:MAG: hypothetical protein A2Y77_02465 [Planctomycetes bacterium RBG_13_62_9]|nr:MAG: hypothetical protein A2Y77_02465 [Planctomycetes bacterium RBG_13_62_9]
MADQMPKTFIVDCPECRAKVAAIEHGCVKINGGIDEEGEGHYGVQVFLGKCPKCRTILAGESQQVAISGYDSEYDEWAEAIRVYPRPPKTFTSRRIPKVVSESITEAVKSLQANANVAACVMFGRALEAICRDLLERNQPRKGRKSDTPPKHPIMLGQGIRKLKEKGLIDERLFDWSQQLQAFRNLAAHPTDTTILREDADDLCSFVYGIIEYVYDLTDRYNEFKKRLAERKAE